MSMFGTPGSAFAFCFSFVNGLVGGVGDKEVVGTGVGDKEMGGSGVGDKEVGKGSSVAVCVPG